MVYLFRSLLRFLLRTSHTCTHMYTHVHDAHIVSLRAREIVFYRNSLGVKDCITFHLSLVFHVCTHMSLCITNIHDAHILSLTD